MIVFSFLKMVSRQELYSFDLDSEVLENNVRTTVQSDAVSLFVDADGEVSEVLFQKVNESMDRFGSPLRLLLTVSQQFTSLWFRRFSRSLKALAFLLGLW